MAATDDEPANTAPPIPEDVILYGAECDALLDYLISLLLGRDGNAQLFIEEHLVSWKPLNRKIRVLGLLVKERRPDIASEAP